MTLHQQIIGKTSALGSKCQHCGSVLSSVTWTCVRGKYCPGYEKGFDPFDPTLPAFLRRQAE